MDRFCSRGHNKRVQDGDPVTHAEIDYNAGRIGKYKDTTLIPPMPCYLCAGAVVQFGIKKVIAGESQTFLRESLWSRTGLR